MRNVLGRVEIVGEDELGHLWRIGGDDPGKRRGGVLKPRKARVGSLPLPGRRPVAQQRPADFGKF